MIRLSNVPEVLLWEEKRGEGGAERKRKEGRGEREGEEKGGEERPMVILDTENIMHCF